MCVFVYKCFYVEVFLYRGMFGLLVYVYLFIMVYFLLIVNVCVYRGMLVFYDDIVFLRMFVEFVYTEVWRDM